MEDLDWQRMFLERWNFGWRLQSLDPIVHSRMRMAAEMSRSDSLLASNSFRNILDRVLEA